MSQAFNWCSGAILATFAASIALGWGGPYEPQPHSAQSVNAAPPAPSPPQHRWVYSDKEGRYGYSVVLSEADKAQGLTSKPLVLIRLLPHGAGDYRFHILHSDNGSGTLVACTEPCKFVETMEFMYGGMRAPQTQIVQLTPGSVVSAVIEDARNGFIRPVSR